MEKLWEQINQTILELSVLCIEPKESMKLQEDFGFDSLKMVELIVALETNLHIEFQESDLDPQEINTVGDIYDLVGKYVIPAH